MKEAFWGVFIILLGAIGIVAINLFQDLTVTTDQNYYLMKEATKAAMEDSLDLSYYRIQGPQNVPKPRIIKEAFVENLTRRFASSAVLNKDYSIVIHDVVEQPPKVSLSLVSNAKDLRGGKYDILLTIDSIYEGIYGGDVIWGDDKFIIPVDGKPDEDIIIPGTDQTPYPEDGKCPNFRADELECISGDLQFIGWGPAPAANNQICPEQLNSLKPQQRDARYKECVCGKWDEPKTETLTANPIRSGTKSTYTWTFKKDGPINDINTSVRQEIQAGICTTDLKILIKDDRPGSLLGGIECPPGGITVGVNETRRLYPRYIPLKSINRNLKWTSDGDEFSIVQRSGPIYYPAKDYIDVTGKRSGYSTVTATSSNGKTAKCKVTVYDKNSIICPSPSLTVYSGDTIQAILENNLKVDGMRYSMKNNGSFASINESTGLITTTSNLTAVANVTYTIYTPIKSVDCSLTVVPRTSTTGDGGPIVVPVGSNACSVGSIALVKWNPNLFKACESQITNRQLSASALLQDSTISVKYCGHSVPINGCRSVYDVNAKIPLNDSSTNARVSSSVTYGKNSYTVNVSVEINHVGWQEDIVLNGCTSKSTTTTYSTSFTYSLATGTSCLVPSNNEFKAKLSCPTELMAGDKAKTISLSGNANPNKTYTVEIDSSTTDGLKLTKSTLPAKISFNGKFTGSAVFTLKDDGQIADSCNIVLNSKLCGGVSVNPKNMLLTVGGANTLNLVNRTNLGDWESEAGSTLAQGAVWSIKSGAQYVQLCRGTTNTCKVTGLDYNEKVTGGFGVAEIQATPESQCSLNSVQTATVRVCPNTDYFCGTKDYLVTKDNTCINPKEVTEKPTCDEKTQVKDGSLCYNISSLQKSIRVDASCPDGWSLYYGYCAKDMTPTTTTTTKYYQTCPAGKSCSTTNSSTVCLKRGHEAPCYSLSESKTTYSCPTGTKTSFPTEETTKCTIDVTQGYNHCKKGYETGKLVNNDQNCIYGDTPSAPGTNCSAHTYKKQYYEGACYKPTVAYKSCKS